MYDKCLANEAIGNRIEAYAWCFASDSLGNLKARKKVTVIGDSLSRGDQSRGLKRANEIIKQWRKANAGKISQPRVGENSTRDRVDPQDIDPRCGVEYECIRWLDSNPMYFRGDEAKQAAIVNQAVKGLDAEKICEQKFPSSFALREQCKQEQVDHASAAKKDMSDLIKFGTKREVDHFVECMARRKASGAKSSLTDMTDVYDCLQ